MNESDGRLGDAVENVSGEAAGHIRFAKDKVEWRIPAIPISASKFGQLLVIHVVELLDVRTVLGTMETEYVHCDTPVGQMASGRHCADGVLGSFSFKQFVVGSVGKEIEFLRLPRT